MATMLIALNAAEEGGQFLGDQLCSLKVAYLFCQNENPSKVILSVSPQNRLNCFWQKFIKAYDVEVVYDSWNPGDWPTRWENWDRWRTERQIEGRPFDMYRELYRRIDGGNRQRVLCGGENGLNRNNIFEYLYYGQENFTLGCPSITIKEGEHFGSELIDHPTLPAERGVYIAPYAKCQRNDVFTMEGFWTNVVTQIVEAGVSVTVGFNGQFCEHLNGHSLYQKFFGEDPHCWEKVQHEMCRHKLIACGNTGIGWLAFASGMPVIAMQHVGSQMPDYHYDKCGCKSLVELIREPDADYVARRIVQEVERVLVMTTGCYDVLHAGHVRHLAESRAMGSKLVVALNSDASVKRRKGDERPVNDQEKRATVLRAIRYVDEVRIFDGDTAEDLIAEMKPNVLTNGTGYELAQVVGKEFVESYGGHVAITCQNKDTTTDLSTTKTLLKGRKFIDVHKAISDAATVSECMPWTKLKLLADQFQTVVGLPGSVADLGAYRGACSLVLRRIAPDKRLHIFDTWAGTPFDDDLCHHKKGGWLASLMECKNLVGEDSLTIYHEGIFPETAQGIEEMFSFVCVDMDTYQSTKDAIEFFWPRLLTGGKLYFDDYAWEPCAGVKKAVDEKFADAPTKAIYPSLFTCVVTKP